MLWNSRIRLFSVGAVALLVATSGAFMLAAPGSREASVRDVSAGSPDVPQRWSKPTTHASEAAPTSPAASEAAPTLDEIEVAPANPATPERPAAPAGVLTYAAEDGTLVAVRPDAMEDAVLQQAFAVPDLGASAGPGEYPSPDGGHTAVVRRDERGTWLDVIHASGGRVASYWLATPADSQVVIGGKLPAAAVQGVPLVVAWSPDSQRLAFGSITGAPWSLSLAAASDWIANSYRVQGGYVGELSWAPDGSMLAVSSYEIARLDHTVLLVDLDRTAVSRLIDGCVIVWSPDSRFVAVHREPKIEPGVWIAPVDRSQPIRVTSEASAFPLSWTEG